jgi:signal transduction histidine kinase
VLVGVLTFMRGGTPDAARLVQVAAWLIGAAGVCYWLWFDARRPDGSRRGLLAVLAITAVAGGIAVPTTNGRPLAAYALLATFAASIELDFMSGVITLAAAIVTIEISTVIAGSDANSMISYPLGLMLLFVAGRNRKAYQLRAEQAAELLAQAERLRAEQRTVAVLDERARIAREIHDVLAHSLGALGIQIRAAHAVLTDTGDITAAINLLDRARRLTDDGLTETRRAIQTLRSGHGGLDQQVEAIVDAHRELHGARVDYTVTGERRPLPAEATVALARTAQEALVNAAKYAEGQPIDIVLAYQPRLVSLTVVNPLTSGGPSAEFSTADAGYGLAGLRERLLLLDGSLTTARDRGTWTLTASVSR